METKRVQIRVGKQAVVVTEELGDRLSWWPGEYAPRALVKPDDNLYAYSHGGKLYREACEKAEKALR